MSGLYDRVEAAMGERPSGERTLGGGCVGDLKRLDFSSGRVLVAKPGAPGSRLDLEGHMLVYLAEKSALPVPEVFLAEDDLLLMSVIEGGDALGREAETHAADLIAALHGIEADEFGFDRDTLIGGLAQPNQRSPSWLEFFRDQRLLYMAGLAREAGRLPGGLYDRVEILAGKLGDWIGDRASPSLIHGDLWGGNVMARDNRIAGFIDPAIYYADAEVELAFSTMFNTFGDAFFSRYREHREIEPGFFEERRDLYNFYPLLVHVRLFGGAYVGAVERTLSRYGA